MRAASLARVALVVAVHCSDRAEHVVRGQYHGGGYHGGGQYHGGRQVD